MQTVPNGTIKELKSKVGPSTFDSWFSNAKFRVEDTLVRVDFPSTFVKNWVNDNYIDILCSAIQSIHGNKEIILGVSSNSTIIKKSIGELSKYSLPLNPKMCLNSFVIGDANKVAHLTALDMVTSIRFNLLYIYSNSGNGKTHLCQGIAQEAIQNGKNVCYISGEQYMFAFINALKNKDIMLFKRSFRDMDLLILDDFQFLVGKNATQEEVLNTLNYLLAQQKQIIITGNKCPADLRVDNRIISRICGGMIAKIDQASLDLRVSILQQKVRDYNKDYIPSEVIHLIATAVSDNIRELEGALLRICANVEFCKAPISISAAESILHEINGSKRKEISIATILKVIGEFYQISSEIIMSSIRKREVVNARQVCMYMIRNLMNKSLPEISKIFGGRDHTTALYSITKIENKIKTDDRFAREIDGLKRSCKNG